MARLASGRSLLHGIVGGVAAGAVVALWFFARDILAGQPFSTPSIMASALLGEEFVGPTARLVVTYSVLHFAVFAALGAITALLFEATSVRPGVLVGAAFGLGVLNAVHYGALLFTNLRFPAVLPAGHVLAANLLGGVTFGLSLHVLERRREPVGWQVLLEHPLLIEGGVTGLFGAAAVAVWLLFVDAMAGMPLRTPAALGSASFLGATSPIEVRYSIVTIGAYTAVHVAAFLLVGLAFAWTAARLERAPAFWLLPLFAFIVLEGLFLGTVGSVSAWVLGAVGWWAVAVGNLLAVGTMAWHVGRSHPKLIRLLASAEPAV